MYKDVIIEASAAPWYSGIDILIAKETLNEFQTVVTKLEFVDTVPGKIIQPTLTISMKSAQRLMDALWHSGIRPTEGMGSAGSMRAVEKHLEDMRKIAFKFIKI